MSLKHFRIVHLVNMVAGKNQHIFRLIIIHKVNILGDCIRRSSVHIQIRIRFLTGRKNKNTAVAGIQSPASSACHITVQKNRFILCQYTYHIDSAVCTVA